MKENHSHLIIRKMAHTQTLNTFRILLKLLIIEARLPVLEQPHESEQPSEYYSRDELCHLAHISSSTLWRMEQDGLIKKRKFGRKNLYLKSEIDALLQEGNLAKRSR